MSLGKQGKGANTSMIIFSIIGVVLVALVGVVVYKMMQEDATGSVYPSSTTTTETGMTTTDNKVSCPSDGTTDARVRVEDSLAATTTYSSSGTVYFVPLTAGLERVTAGSLSSSDYSTAVDIKCTSAGTKWKPVYVTDQDDYHSAEGSTFTAEGAYVKADLVSKAFDGLQAKVEDKYTGGATFFNESTCAGTATTGYVYFDGNQCAFKDQVGNTALKVDADEYIDARIYIKTNATKKQFGEDGLRTWMLVNADGSAWDEPIVARDGGAKLQNQITSLASEDVRKYSGYEYAYEIGAIGDRESYIDFYLDTAAGVDPGASNDPVIDFCAEGRYNSNKQKDTILVGCWTDASTQVEVATTNRHYMKFDVTA